MATGEIRSSSSNVSSTTKIQKFDFTGLYETPTITEIRPVTCIFVKGSNGDSDEVIYDDDEPEGYPED